MEMMSVKRSAVVVHRMNAVCVPASYFNVSGFKNKVNYFFEVKHSVPFAARDSHSAKHVHRDSCHRSTWAVQAEVICS